MSVGTADRRRILLVDDIELNRVLTEAVLRGATYDVDCVGDGMAAIAAVEAKSYDLVLMDLDLPGIGGHETAVAIQCSLGRDQGAAMKVVALSSRRGVEARLRSREVGMSAHIGRPIAPRQLLREIEQVFGPTLERPDPWDYTLYEEWVARLGASRMRGFLTKLHDQLRTLLVTLVDSENADDLHRRAHDAASTGGMLGFMEVTRGCRAFLETTDAASGGVAHTALTDALERAILRLDGYLSAQKPTAKTRTFDS